MHNSWILLVILQIVIIHIFYFISLSKHKGDLADLAWTILILSWGVYFFLPSIHSSRNYIIFALILIWGLRLGHLILTNRILKPGEDSRYRNLREKWGDRAKLKFYILFLAQVLMAGILAIPFWYIFQRNQFVLTDYLGLALFFTGYQGVSLADAQLAKFKSLPDSVGKVCDIGLWQYSRHPNYFFEWLIWLSYVFFCFGIAGSWIALISPVFMLILLLFITGVPPSEKQSLLSRGEAYAVYQKKTSKFFPWIPTK